MSAKSTPGPWFVSGARFTMNGGEWHSVNRYDEAKRQDENIACVGYDPRTGFGLADAHLIAAAPDMADVIERIVAWKDAVSMIAPELGGLLVAIYRAEAVLSRARGEAKS